MKQPRARSNTPKRPDLHRVDAWTVAETVYAPELNEYYETVFTLANGAIGVRGSPEEGFSGEHRNPASYAAGVYAHYDAPHEWNRTGFAVKSDRMVQILDWIGLSFTIGGRPFDPAASTVTDYARVLDLRRGILTRTLVATDAAGRATRFEFTRFVSQVRPAIGAIRCTVTPLGHKASIQVRADLRGRAGKHYRSLVKAVSWCLTGSVDTLVISFLITGNLKCR